VRTAQLLTGSTYRRTKVSESDRLRPISVLSVRGRAPLCASPRNTLPELVNEKRRISPEMAVRLSMVFGGSAESWLTQQAHYDLTQLHADRIELKRLELA